MSHQIYEDDSLQLWKEAAWHKKGTVFTKGKTPREAAEDGGLLWTVEQFPLIVTLPDGREVTDRNHVLNVRMDTGHSFGPVGTGYAVHQPLEFIEFIESLADDAKDLKVETLGTYNHGAVMFASVHLDSFGVGMTNSDTNHIYADFLTSWDMSYPWLGFPSSIRPVCANTVRFAFDRRGSDGIKLRHTRMLRERIEEARDAILGFKKQGKEYAKQAKAMADKPMSSSEVAMFFAKTYKAMTGRFLMNAESKEENRLLNRQNNVLETWLWNNTEAPEQQIDGVQGTVWAALNSITQWADHDKTVRTSKGIEKDEARSRSNLLGTSNEVKRKALSLALAAL